MTPDPDTIRAAWERYHGPVADLDGYIPRSPPAYDRGYRDGYAAALDESHADAVIRAMKLRIQLLRIELRDALMVGYGARVNWPESARELLK